MQIHQIVGQVEIIRHRGYPVEVHDVITEDGYILQLHRIPHGRKRKPPGRPVFLQHGVLNTAAVWVLNPTEKSLGELICIFKFSFFFRKTMEQLFLKRKQFK